jgi:hypothetical protein
MDHVVSGDLQTAAGATFRFGREAPIVLALEPGGARSWIYRFRLNGRTRDMGLGALADVSLDTTAPAPAPPSSGWQNERPLGTQPGIDLIDRMCINADRRERQQTQQPADSERMMEIMVTMMQMQSQTLHAVAAAILRDDKGKPKLKSKPGTKAK